MESLRGQQGLGDQSGHWAILLAEADADAIAAALESSGHVARCEPAFWEKRLSYSGDGVVLAQLNGHPWTFALFAIEPTEEQARNVSELIPGAPHQTELPSVVSLIPLARRVRIV